MKNVSAEVAAILATRHFLQADLYEFTLANGQVLRCCGGDADIVFAGNTYSAGGTTGPVLSREGENGRLHYRLGLDVDTFEFDMMPGTATLLGLPYPQAAHMGFFDGADFILWRAFMAAYGSLPNGAIKAFVGELGSPRIMGGSIHFVANSLAVKLNSKLPKNVYSATCINALGDAACAVNLELFAQTGVSIATGTTNVTVVATMAPLKLTGYHSLGRLLVTTGTLAGFSFPIKTYTNTTPTATFALARPMPLVLPAGTGVKVYPGCNKLLSNINGCTKFNNKGNFRGHPYIPAPEIAV